MFKSVNRQTHRCTDGRRLDWYTISSPCAFGSGELTNYNGQESLMLNAKFCGNRPAGFLKGFYHIWAWWPAKSCDQHHIDKFSFPCAYKLTFKIWLKMAHWFLRKASFNFQLNLVIRKQAFCIFEKKDTDQLCSECTADQCLYFHYTNSTIPLLHKSEISSL